MGFDIEQYILGHVQNSREWHLPLLSPIHLPPPLRLHELMLLLGSALLIFVFVVLYRKNSAAPSGLTNFLEMVIVYIRDEIAVPSLGKEDGRKLTPLLCTFFFFILGMNLMGLIPVFSSATSNLNVTGGLALVTLSFMIFGSMYKLGFAGFWKSFIPSGVPLPVCVLLVPIEFLGLFIKAFALMIRLFANMLAGHIVIMSILGLVVLIGFAALPVVGLAVFISLLEVFVAFLQAYIFTMLSAMFIGQMYHPQH